MQQWSRQQSFSSSSRWSLFLRLLVLVSLPFFILWQGSLYIGAVLVHGRRITATREATRRAHDLLDDSLKNSSADLKILSNDGNLLRLIAGDDTAKDAVAQDFAVAVAAKPAIAQLRYIDRNGDEIVRVDRDRHTHAVIRRLDLQNKGDRYFFRQSILLPQNTLYISAIDLNMDHGKIELPWNPMLRLAVPLGTPEAGTRGVLVVNMSMEDLMTRIENERPVNSGPVQLLDAQGYWLAGVSHEQLWGFLFNHDSTMMKTSPEAWSRIASANSGGFDSRRIHYAFQTSKPALYASVGPDGSTLPAVGPEWKIVGLVPAVSFSDMWHSEDLITALMGVLLVSLIAYGWSRETTRRHNAEDLKKKTELEMIHNERLASLGSLVAGVAHEMGTPIGNAVTIASTLSEQVRSFSAEVASGQVRRSRLDTFLNDTRDGTNIMLRGLERAALLIRHFKQVAVDQTNEKRRTFKLADLIHDIVATVQPQFKHTMIRLEDETASRAELDSYPGLLEQVLLNLIANARIHGFEDGQPGSVVITAKDLSSQQVEISICDTGKGMDADTLKRIFEPFFTTRLGSGGSGLGLSIVFNIVTNILGGTIHAESQPGQGVTMIVCLPLIAPAENRPDAERTYHVER